MSKKNEIIIGPYRCMYPALVSPKGFEGSDPKYGITLLIPKSDKAGAKLIMDFVESQVGATNWKPTVKAQVKKVAKDNSDGYKDNAILKDGDKLNERREGEDKAPLDAYYNHYRLTLKRTASFGAPLVVDENAEPVDSMLLADTVKSGYWVKVQIQAYCYPSPKPGVTLQLLGVQFIKEDEVFGQTNPFEAVDPGDEEVEM